MSMNLASISPAPLDRRRFDWHGGSFTTARRPLTARVEGHLATGAPTLMVTLRGGARHHELSTDDGFCYSGADRAGTFSFMPAGGERRLVLRDVAWQWASLTLKADALPREAASHARPFVAHDDGAVVALLGEMQRLLALDGALDPAYCDSVSLTLTHYVAQRYWRIAGRGTPTAQALPAWRLRRVIDYVDAHLGSEIRIADLARLVDLSEGHFFRAFRSTTGQTPLAMITARRIERARSLLAAGDLSVAAVGAQFGFVNASHFARTFRAATGSTPSRYRNRHRLEPR
jgi:AraC family transcriptional regulator